MKNPVTLMVIDHPQGFMAKHNGCDVYLPEGYTYNREDCVRVILTEKTNRWGRKVYTSVPAKDVVFERWRRSETWPYTTLIHEQIRRTWRCVDTVQTVLEERDGKDQKILLNKKVVKIKLCLGESLADSTLRFVHEGDVYKIQYKIEAGEVHENKTPLYLKEQSTSHIPVKGLEICEVRETTLLVLVTTDTGEWRVEVKRSETKPFLKPLEEKNVEIAAAVPHHLLQDLADQAKSLLEAQICLESEDGAKTIEMILGRPVPVCPYYYMVADGKFVGSKFNQEALQILAYIDQAQGQGRVNLLAWLQGNKHTWSSLGDTDYFIRTQYWSEEGLVPNLEEKQLHNLEVFLQL